MPLSQAIAIFLLAFLPCRRDLFAAMPSWLRSTPGYKTNSRTVEQILVEGKTLTSERHALVAALEQRHLEAHDHNAEKNLAA